jgi:hypothetical protein
MRLALGGSTRHPSKPGNSVSPHGSVAELNGSIHADVFQEQTQQHDALLVAPAEPAFNHFQPAGHQVMALSGLIGFPRATFTTDVPVHVHHRCSLPTTRRSSSIFFAGGIEGKHRRGSINRGGSGTSVDDGSLP